MSTSGSSRASKRTTISLIPVVTVPVATSAIFVTFPVASLSRCHRVMACRVRTVSYSSSCSSRWVMIITGHAGGTRAVRPRVADGGTTGHHRAVDVDIIVAACTDGLLQLQTSRHRLIVWLPTSCSSTTIVIIIVPWLRIASVLRPTVGIASGISCTGDCKCRDSALLS